MKTIFFIYSVLFLMMGMLGTTHAQELYIIDVNVNSQPFTVRMSGTIPQIEWHNLIIEYFDEPNNSIEIRCQFEGSTISNALTIFDTTVVLQTSNPVFDLCVYVDWFEETTISIDTLLLDSLCLTASEILSIDLNNISFKAPSIFPNPAQDHFFIVFDENADVSQTREVKVYDLSGVLQFTREMKANDYVLEISTENLAEGMYLVVISADGKEISTQKVAVR